MEGHRFRANLPSPVLEHAETTQQKHLHTTKRSTSISTLLSSSPSNILQWLTSLILATLPTTHDGRIKVRWVVRLQESFPALLQLCDQHTRTIRAKLLTFGICRQELLAWLNNLLQLNVTKVEQCGTGYALLCSAFHNIPMTPHFSCGENHKNKSKELWDFMC